VVGLAIAAGPASGASSSSASPIPKDSCEQAVGQTAFGSNPRVIKTNVGGSRVRVLLPPRYRKSKHRYPVLYLLHGAQGSADSWLVYSDLISFTASLPDKKQAIVVMADTTLSSGMDLNWADHTHAWETYVVHVLPHWVARHLRARTGRRHTAIAGYSGGGYSALHLAEAHPHRYAAVGGFSPVGSLSFAGVAGESALWAVFHGLAVCDGSDPAGPGILPDPVHHKAAWRKADPVTGVKRLRHMSVYVASGNGQVCSPTDAQYAAYGVPLAEAAIHLTVKDLNKALTKHHVRHRTDLARVVAPVHRRDPPPSPPSPPSPPPLSHRYPAAHTG